MRVVNRRDRAWLTPGLGSADAPVIMRMTVTQSPQELKEDIVSRLLELEQQGEAWYAWRSQGIGASESAAILGLNPWESREGVLALKLGKRDLQGENKWTQQGKRREPEARALYEALMGWQTPPACAVHDDYEFIRASLDGIRADGKVILEAKCPSVKWHSHSVLNGPPDWYLCQVQHQLLVTGASVAHFVSYCPEYKKRPFYLAPPILPDREFQEILLRELIAFWEEVMRERQNH